MSVTYAEKVYCTVNGAERTGWGKQFGMGATPTLRLTRKPFLQMSAHESWAKYWLEMAARRRDLPEFEFAEIIEVDSLTSSIESIWQGWSPDFRQEFSSPKKNIDKLFEEIYGRTVVTQAKPATNQELHEAYLKMVSTIDIVRQVFLFEAEDITAIWTIIDAPPFEDSVCTPIYDAQLKILRMLKEDMLFDFHVFNISELSDDVKLKHIIPSNANLVWQR